VHFVDQLLQAAFFPSETRRHQAIPIKWLKNPGPFGIDSGFANTPLRFLYRCDKRKRLPS